MSAVTTAPSAMLSVLLIEKFITAGSQVPILMMVGQKAKQRSVGAMLLKANPLTQVLSIGMSDNSKKYHLKLLLKMTGATKQG
ncbi:hypothetical protein [Vibrio rhizosphaerae]|uniref:hypothetical protein n=1 Tax=Vibrio rhizosphaerae TaxID=398736 RepID=UPI0012FB317B|nr:hypothetical protein [Vibrio rhizosphaerae]